MNESYYDPESSPSRYSVDMHIVSDVGSSRSDGGVVESSGVDGNHTIPSGVVYCVQDGRIEDRPSFAIDFVGPIRGGEHNQFLTEENPETTLTLCDLSTLRGKYDIPQSYSLALPSGPERADWKIDGCTTMYELPLIEGARLPLPKFLLEVCNYHGISPSQLTPNAWRILMATERFGEMKGISLTCAEFLTAYHLQRSKNDYGRYMLVNQLKENRLIFEKKSSDRGWQSRYFFIPFDALGASDYPNIPHSWDSACCTRSSGSVVLLDVEAKISEWLKFSPRERAYETILTRRNLHRSSLWSRVRDILCDSEGFPMSNRYRPPLQGESAMDKVRQRKKKPAASSRVERIEEPAEVLAPAIPAPRRKRRVEPVDSTMLIGDTINLSFPSSIVAQSNFGPYLAEAEKLIFLNDSDHFDDMGISNLATSMFSQSFQVMQKAGKIRQEVMMLITQVKDLQAERADWRAEIKKAEEYKAAADKMVEDLKATHEDEVRRAASKYDALAAQFQSLKDDVDYIAAETEVRAKGAMAELYRQHHPDGPWDVTPYEKDVKELDEAVGLTDGPVGSTYVDPDCDPMIDCSFDQLHEPSGGHGDV